MAPAGHAGIPRQAEECGWVVGGVLQWTVISSLRLIRLRYLNYANDFGA